MIKKDTIEEFIKLMVEHDLVELDVADGEQSITLRRADPSGGYVSFVGAPPAMAATANVNAASSPAAGGSSASEAGAGFSEASGTTIDSPMVGTFYSRPNPDADPFISVGSRVSDGTVVCLIEAMKVFNEIKAECSGEIVEILVADGDPVEFGQPIFRVKS